MIMALSLELERGSSISIVQPHRSGVPSHFLMTKMTTKWRLSCGTDCRSSASSEECGAETLETFVDNSKLLPHFLYYLMC